LGTDSCEVTAAFPRIINARKWLPDNRVIQHSRWLVAGERDGS